MQQAETVKILYALVSVTDLIECERYFLYERHVTDICRVYFSGFLLKKLFALHV